MCVYIYREREREINNNHYCYYYTIRLGGAQRGQPRGVGEADLV